MKKSELVYTRSQIAKLTAESKAIRKQIHASSGMAKWMLWQEKRAVGYSARRELLAYAFLRGVPYRVVEPTARTREGSTVESSNKWLAAEISACIHKTYTPVDYDLNASVKAWLEVPEALERTKARVAAREAYAAKGAKMRAERAAVTAAAAVVRTVAV